MAGDVVSVMDSAGFDRAHMLGYSMGGSIAMEMGAKYPGRVRSLFLAGAAARPSSRARLRTGTFLNMFNEWRGFESVFRLFIPWFFSEKFMENGAAVESAMEGLTKNP